jgi:hypothetical protein
MADEAHLAVLKQGADAWNAWRAAHSGTPADLANASLRGLDLAEAETVPPRPRPCLWRSCSDDRRPAMNGANGAQYRGGIE